MERLERTYTISDQIKVMQSDPVIWERRVRGWIEGEKKAMKASDAEFEQIKGVWNPLVKILEWSKGPEPTIQGGGTKAEKEEEEEELVIRRRRKGKMVMEEEEEDTTPGIDAAAVFVKEMDTHVPVSLLSFIFEGESRSQEGLADVEVTDAIETTPITVESVPVETGHIPEGVTGEEGEEDREQQAPVGQGQGDGNDDNDDDDDDDENEEAEADEP